jgi:tRNA threonylcarbamoyladenosine biosynthesis protein TsaE
MRVRLTDKIATAEFGRALAESIGDQAVIALIGPMGAGKTTLVQAVAAALGVTEVVSSPTFTMLNEYHSGRLPLYHMDLYRLSEDATPAPLDLLIAEVEEFIDSPMVAMVEWAELFPSTGSNVASDSAVSSPTRSASYLSQLDHLVIKLNYQEQAAVSHPYQPPAQGAEKMLKRPSGGRSEAVSQGETANTLENRINKDEDLRIADLSAHGERSTEVLIRLRSRVAAMLIYS